jgi:hypothetical protein
VQEVRWACYGWPASLGNSGNRAFVISQQGEVFSTANKDVQDYDATTNIPGPDEAFVVTGAEVALNLEGQFITGDTTCADGGPWLPAGN